MSLILPFTLVNDAEQTEHAKIGSHAIERRQLRLVRPASRGEHRRPASGAQPHRASLALAQPVRDAGRGAQVRAGLRQLIRCAMRLPECVRRVCKIGLEGWCDYGTRQSYSLNAFPQSLDQRWRPQPSDTAR
jgi:hypothetical protein